MADVTWLMSDQTIVRRIDAEGRQDTFDPPHLNRVKQGERMQFDAHVNVELLPQGQLLKKATVFSNVPDGGTWELICDEGTAVGGRGTAPSPLMYFAAGLGLCLMSHVEMLAKHLGITLTRAKLEQRTRFSTTLDLGGIHPKDVFGKGEHAEMHLIIDSDAPAPRVDRFVHWCRQACMAIQTVLGETSVPVMLHLNGEPRVINGWHEHAPDDGRAPWPMSPRGVMGSDAGA